MGSPDPHSPSEQLLKEGQGSDLASMAIAKLHGTGADQPKESVGSRCIESTSAWSPGTYP